MRRTVTFKWPRDWKEFMRWLKQAEPILRVVRLVFVCILAVIVLGMKDTIVAMEFDPTMAGLLVWVMMLWFVITTGFR